MPAALKLPANDRRPPRTRAVVTWIAIFVAVGALTGLFLSTPSPRANEPAEEQPAAPLSPETAGETCLQLSENPPDYLSREALNQRHELRRASCNVAFAPHPDNVHYKVAVARAMPVAQRAEQLAMLREARIAG